MEELQYLDLINTIAQKGVQREDRTKIGTYSLFCPNPLRFSLENDKMPLLTTKQMPWKTVIKELLWFLRGETNAKILQQQGVKIWDGNSSREFLDARGLSNYPDGELGPIYGFNFRHFGAHYEPSNKEHKGGVDQIAYLIDTLKTDPFSRRLVLSAWNPCDLAKCALPPCHMFFELYVTPEKSLSLHFHMRSSDVFLGLPFNIFSYAVLLRILACKTGMQAKEVIVTFGDAHIYKNHIDQVKLQLERKPFDFPTMQMSKDVETLDFHQIDIKHFKLIDYKSYETLKAPMAV